MEAGKLGNTMYEARPHTYVWKDPFIDLDFGDGGWETCNRTLPVLRRKEVLFSSWVPL